MSGLAEHVVYTVPNGVTVAAREKAMIPICNLSLPGAIVLLYDPHINEVNAMRAVHLQNTSDMVLANGVVAVLEENRYVAQAPFTVAL